VKFSSRKDDWFYLPLLILSFILGLNLLIISFLFTKLNLYFVFGIILLIYFILILILSSKKTKGKDYVRDYKLTRNTISILILGLFINFYGLFKILNHTREKNILNKSETNYKKLKKENYEYKVNNE
jgi:membrane-bound ClpP family serine protease